MDLTPIFEAVITLIAAVISCVLIPYIRKKTTAQEQERLLTLAKMAVTAAEQIFEGVGRGEEKKAYATHWLAAHNLKVDGDAIDAAIESAVYIMNVEWVEPHSDAANSK